MAPSPNGHNLPHRLASALLVLARLAPTAAYALAHPLSSAQASQSHAEHILSKRAQHDPSFIVQACLIPVLVLLSGAFAGLTLGYFSLDETQLRVLIISGNEEQQKMAKQIQPIRRDGHLLLTTLLISNMIVNETLPILTENVLGGGIQAVVISTVLIVIFSEIIPQSVCSRYGLYVGAKAAIPVRCLTYFLFPIAWPVAKVLEFFLGAHQGIVYRRNELKELVNMHVAGQEHGGDLASDTVGIIGGALDFQVKTVREAMTPLDKIFSLDIDAKLDYETLARVVRSGHSRIPVFEDVKTGDKTIRKCLGVLLVKQCVLLDPEDATPLRTIPLNKIPYVPYDEPLLGILDRFQEGRSHMALVSRVPRRQEPALARPGDNKKIPEEDGEEEAGIDKLTRKFLNRVRKNEDGDGKDEEKGNMDEKPLQDGQKETMFNKLEQGMPGDAVLARENAEKFLQGVEGSPLGIITLEDVLEELIGEEILDEFDLTGAQALPASMFVPEEAQRAVDSANAKRRRGPRVVAGLKRAGMGDRTRSRSVDPMKAGLPGGTPVRRASAPGQTDAPEQGEKQPDPPAADVAADTSGQPVEPERSAPPTTTAAAAAPAAKKGLFKSKNQAAEVWKDNVVGAHKKPPAGLT